MADAATMLGATPAEAAATPPAAGAATDTTTTPAATAAGQQAPAVKAGETTTTGEKAITKEGEPAKATEAAPAEIEIKLPEGVAADDVLLSEFKPIAKELGLDSAKAQKLVDLYSKQLDRFGQQAQEQWQKRETEWVTQVKADKELGGAKFDENLAVAKRAVERFGGPELRKVLEETRLGNHPELIRAFYKAGLAIKDDSVKGRMSNGASAKSDAELIKARYPNTPQFHDR